MYAHGAGKRSAVKNGAGIEASSRNFVRSCIIVVVKAVGGQIYRKLNETPELRSTRASLVMKMDNDEFSFLSAREVAIYMPTVPSPSKNKNIFV